MYGTITTKHLVTKAPTIIQEFGIRSYINCIYKVFLSKRPVTFLECVVHCCEHSCEQNKS